MVWENGEIITANKLNNMEDRLGENNMSYEKHTWETGELITAEKLNHMEEGIEGGGSGANVITVAVTYINNGLSSRTLEYQNFVEDNELKYGNRALNSGETAILNLLAVYTEELQHYTIYGLEYSLDSSDVLSNEVNCSYDESSYYLKITDSTQPASCTVTFNGDR